MNIGYTSIDRIFAKFQRDYAISVHEADLVEWTGEALEAIGATRLYQENVAFIEVNNYTCELPDFLFSINQIARDNHWNESDSNSGICPAEVITSKYENDTEHDESPDADFPIFLDCNLMPISDYELGYYRPFFDLMWDYPQWRKSPLYKRFSPVRKSTNSFFNFMSGGSDNVCAEDFGDNCTDEYRILDGRTVRFNFEKGMVAISYLKYRVDDKTGYPMIPYHEVYTTAITTYCIMKYSKREFYAGREGSQSRMDKSEVDWQWYCKRASTHAKMPSVDDLENLMNQRNRLIDTTNHYNSFFGKLNKEQFKNYDVNQKHRRIIT